MRAPLAALLPLLAIYLVAGAAGGLVVLAALAFDLDLDVSTPQIIHVVLVGIGVDYFLFLLFRLRERLRAGDDRRPAALASALRIGPVIASAALAIIVAFATLALAKFGGATELGRVPVPTQRTRSERTAVALACTRLGGLVTCAAMPHKGHGRARARLG